MSRFDGSEFASLGMQSRRWDERHRIRSDQDGVSLHPFFLFGRLAKVANITC